MRWKSMTPAQRGAYWQLICWQMQGDDGTLPGDPVTLSSLSDLDLSSVNACVLEAFPLLPSGRRANQRALREWQKRKAISGVRSEVGSAGVAKRWQDHSKPIAIAIQPDSKPIAIAATTTTTTTATVTPTAKEESRWQAMLDKYRALGVNIEVEQSKAEAWLLSPRGAGRKMTQRFFANWLGRAAESTKAVEGQAIGGYADPDNDPLLKHRMR
jgi:hypothetical protein